MDRERKLRLEDLHGVKKVMRSTASTPCARSPLSQPGECFARGTATFLLLGDVCTRACGFCDIANGKPAAVDPMEPWRVKAAVEEMALRFVVLTSVDRDDLPDGGAAHYAACVRAIKAVNPSTAVEALTPDFLGASTPARRRRGQPDVFNHNVETVPRLYASVRRGAKLDRSLGLLSAARSWTRSHDEVRLHARPREREDEVRSLLEKMRAAGVDIVTIGQYLRPSRENLPVVEYVHPEVFDRHREFGEALGFRHVFAGPFVRSSYRAEEALLAAGAGA